MRTTDTSPARSEGTFSVENDSIATFTYGDGSVYDYVADTLTVTRKDGTLDRWIRGSDLKGVLKD